MIRIALLILALTVAAPSYGVQWLKQSTATTIKLGPFVDSSDGVTAETGLTISQADVRLSKNAGNYAQKNESSAATHDELGDYEVDLDATDTNTLGRLRVMVQESGAAPVWQDFMVVPANTYDSLIAGSDTLESDVVAVDGTAASSALASASDIVDEFETQSQADPTGFHVNVLEVGGTAQTANDIGADTNAILDDTGTGGSSLGSGTAQGGTASTIQLAAAETAADDVYNQQIVMITGGTGAGQSRLITDYVSSTDTATVSPNWAVNPASDSEYVIQPGSVNVVQVEAFDATEVLSGSVTAAIATYDPPTLAELEATIEKITGVGVDDIIVIKHDGDNKTSFEALEGALESTAGANDVVLVGPGVYDGEGDSLNCTAGVTVIGSGRGATRIISTGVANGTPVMTTAGSNCVFRDFTVDGLAGNEGTGGGVAISWITGAHRDFRAERLDVRGQNDSMIYIPSSGTRSLHTWTDCTFYCRNDGNSGTTDNIIVAGTTGATTVDFVRCRVYTDGGTQNEATGIKGGGNGNNFVNFYDGFIEVVNTTNNATGMRVDSVAGATEFKLYRTQVRTRSTSGTALDLNKADSDADAILAICDCDYDSTKTSGTITAIGVDRVAIKGDSAAVVAAVGTPADLGSGATLSGNTQDLSSGVATLTGTQPRINYAPTVKLKLASRNDGVYVCNKPVRLLPGTFDVEKTIGIDCTPVFGSKVQVATIGDCTVSGGSITATGLGPRDEYAMIQLDGTATASETQTVDVELTMDNGDKVIARFEIEVAGS